MKVHVVSVEFVFGVNLIFDRLPTFFWGGLEDAVVDATCLKSL